jgi:hypothetical protein
MKRNSLKGLMGLIAGAAMLMACEVFGVPIAPTPDPSLDWASPIQTAAALQPDEIPDHLLQATPQPQATDFDPNQYFTAFTHLSMEQGYVLDYNYQYDGMGGWPYLFARLEGNDTVEAGEALPYLEHVQTDGSEMGYYELAAFDMMAGQFYLFWHANYNDTVIVPDNATREAILTSVTSGDMGYAMEEDSVREARAIDITPQVTINGDTVTVRFVTFSNFTGFTERIYTIAKEFPHIIMNEESKVLVEYNWGIVF